MTINWWIAAPAIIICLLAFIALILIIKGGARNGD